MTTVLQEFSLYKKIITFYEFFDIPIESFKTPSFQNNLSRKTTGLFTCNKRYATVIINK